MTSSFLKMKHLPPRPRKWAQLLTLSVLLHLAAPTTGATQPQEAPPPETPPPAANPRVPKFQLIRPKWGVEVTSTLGAFGRQALVPAQETHQAYGFSLQLEYQPPFIQEFGILGIGPSLAAYPIFGGSTRSIFSLWSAGAQIRYQARYFRNQWLVPIVGYNYEYLNYHYADGPSGAVPLKGLTYGLWLLLNIIEPSSAAQFYIDQGVLRSYLVFEVRQLTGSDPQLENITDSSYYFGLRFEF